MISSTHSTNSLEAEIVSLLTRVKYAAPNATCTIDWEYDPDAQKEKLVLAVKSPTCIDDDFRDMYSAWDQVRACSVELQEVIVVTIG